MEGEKKEERERTTLMKTLTPSGTTGNPWFAGVAVVLVLVLVLVAPAAEPMLAGVASEGALLAPS